MIDYTLIRSKRKTIAIHITKDAAVEVRAPMKASKADIDRFVTAKQAWISKHLSAREQSMRSNADFTLNFGDMAAFCGKTVPIRAKAGNRIGFDGECFYMPPDLPPEEIKRAAIQIYRLTAKRLLTNKVIEYAKAMGVRPIAVKVNGAKTRWGSCSGNNSINFSWRLIMADEDVIDYVAVHELAHIKEHNHSPRFWAVVESILPDCNARKQKLKALQKKLSYEDWE